MNKLSISILLLITICGTSCKKFLDTKPTDFVVPEQYYNTEAQLREALAGVYSSLTTTATYSLYQSFYLVTGTDVGYYKLNTSSPFPGNYNITVSDPKVNSTWNDLYDGIDRANYLLANINKPVMDEHNRNFIKGEALFLRAYMYFLLVSQWGDVPMLLEPTVDSRKVDNPAASSKDVYTQIISDMTKAKDLVNDYNANGSPVHVCKTAVEAMLARVNLKMAGEPLKDVSRYTQARAWADSVIESHEHSLNPDYKQIFINESADLFDNAYKEVLWEIDFYGNNIGTLNLGGRWAIFFATRNVDKNVGYSYGYLGATSYLYNLYKPGDLRRDWAISPYSIYRHNGDIQVITPLSDIYSREAGKWRRQYETVLPRSTTFAPTNFPVIRYADVLLMFAEADNEINGPTQAAYEALNEVRRRAFGLAVTAPADSVKVVSDISVDNAGSGYLKTINTIPVTISGGGGNGATALASVSPSTGKITAIGIQDPGKDYQGIPSVTIGTEWTPYTAYASGMQVFNGDYLYTVTTAGSSTLTPPTNTSGVSDPTVTGASFTYAGTAAKGKAATASSTVDLSDLSQQAFSDTIRAERARELCFEGLRKFDLIRWGIFVQRMKDIGADMRQNMPSSLKYLTRAYTNVSDKDVLFPIPLNELNLNKAMQQNPLWQ